MDDRQTFHLRRIGPSASKPGVADIMDFEKVTYLIGRSPTMVDYVIDSCDSMKSMFISRCHARVVRQAGNKHRLFDDSMNGIFINNVKITGSCILQEGDRVTFGHPMGSKLPSGIRVRQPDSEYQFIFEQCSCPRSTRVTAPRASAEDQPSRNARKQEFRVPLTNRTNVPKKAEKADRKTMRDFTAENIKKPDLDSAQQHVNCVTAISTNTGIQELKISQMDNERDSNVLQSSEMNSEMDSSVPDKQLSSSTGVNTKLKEIINNNHTISKLEEKNEMEGDVPDTTVCKDTYTNLNQTHSDCNATCIGECDGEIPNQSAVIKPEVQSNKSVLQTESSGNENGSKQEQEGDLNATSLFDCTDSGHVTAKIPSRVANENCKSPQIKLGEDLVHSPLMQEAKKIYNLVKDINKTLNQAQDMDNESTVLTSSRDAKHDTDRKVSFKTDAGIQTSQAVVNASSISTCTESDALTKHDVMVQTSQVATLPTVSYNSDIEIQSSTMGIDSESLQSSQSSIADTEISEENMSDGNVNSAVETDESSISEAQTVVVEMCHKEYVENDIVSDTLSSAVESVVGDIGIVELYSTKEIADSNQYDLRSTENQTDYINDSSVSEALVCTNFETCPKDRDETDQGSGDSSFTVAKENSEQNNVCTGNIISGMKTYTLLNSKCSMSAISKKDEVICANDTLADEKCTEDESEHPDASSDIVSTVNAESGISIAEQESASYGGSDHECVLIQTDRSVDVTNKFDFDNIESQSETADMPNLVLSDSVEYDCDWTSEYDTEDNHSEKSIASENSSEVESSRKSFVSDDDCEETIDSDKGSLVFPDSPEYQVEIGIKNDNEFELEREQETVPKSASEKEVKLVTTTIEQSPQASNKGETKDNRCHVTISELEKSCLNTSTLDIKHQPVSDFDTCMNYVENCLEIDHELNIVTAAAENKNNNATEKVTQETTNETMDSVYIVCLSQLVCEPICDEPELNCQSKASDQFESKQDILKGKVSEVSKLSEVSDYVQGKSDEQEHTVDTEVVPNLHFLGPDELTFELENDDKERSTIVENSGKELLLENETLQDTETSQLRICERVPKKEAGERLDMDISDDSINELSSVESKLKQVPTSCCWKDNKKLQESPEVEVNSEYAAGSVKDDKKVVNQRNVTETVNEIEGGNNQSVFEMIDNKHDTVHITSDAFVNSCIEAQTSYSYKRGCSHEEETFKFVSPVIESKYQGKDSYFDKRETGCTYEEKASFLEPDSGAALSVETGLEAIALPILETDGKNEALPSVSISDQLQETGPAQTITDKNKYQIIDSREKSIELEDFYKCSPPIEVNTDMKSICKSDNTVISEKQSVSVPNLLKNQILESRKECEIEISCPISGTDVYETIASETEGRDTMNTRKRKISDRDQDCAIDSDLPVKKVCPEHTSCVENDHLEIKDSKFTQQRASELRNCVSNFFMFRDKLNRLNSRSPAKVRQQNIGKIVKRFFKLWHPKKKTYNILNSKDSLSDTCDLVDIKYKILKDKELVTNSHGKSKEKEIGPECSDSSRMPDFIEDDSVQVKMSDEKESMEEKSNEIRTESETGHNRYSVIITGNTESSDELIQSDFGQKYLLEENSTKSKQIIDNGSLSNSEVEKTYQNESVTSQTCTDQFSSADIESSNDNESQNTNDSDLIVGHVSGVVRSSDVSFVDASVCYSDSDVDTNYDFLFKTSMKKVTEHIASELPPGENKTDVSNEDASHKGDRESDEIDIRSPASMTIPATNYESDSLCHDTDTDSQSDCLSSYYTLDIKVSENEQEKGVDSENEMLVEECNQFEQMSDNNLSRGYLLHDKDSVESSDIDKADDKDIMHGNEAENEGVDDQTDVSRDSSLAKGDLHEKETVLCQEGDEMSEAYENKLEGQVDELSGMQQCDSDCQKGIGTAEKKQATMIANNKVTDKQNLEDLSCRFSDTDDDDDFVSPVIDFSHLDEDSDDGLQCGQKEERNEQSIKCSVLDSTTDFNPAEDTDTNEEIDEEETTMICNESEHNTKVSENQTVKSDGTDSVHRSVETDGSNRDTICWAYIENQEKSDDDFSPDVDLHFKDNESSASEQEYEEMPFHEDSNVAELPVYGEDDEEEMPFFEDNEEGELPVSADAAGGKKSTSDCKNITKTDLKYCDDSTSADNACNIDKDILSKNCENTTSTSEIEDIVNVTESTEGRMRTPGRRKCSFTDIISPKIAKYDNKGMSTFEIVTAVPSCQEDATFKSPKLCPQASNRGTETPIDKENTSQIQNDFCSTQVLCSSQQPDLDDLSVSQMTTVARQLEFKAVDRSRTSAMRNKAREILARLKAKKDQQVKEKAQTVSSCIEETDDQLPSSQERQSSIQSVRSEAQLSLLKDEQNIQSIEKVIQELKMAFQTSSLKNNARIQAWRQELSTIEQKLTTPQTVIAVVGGTGEGKSSLMNALLDHRSVLPTSGIRACTAVVVEVVNNTTSDTFEADIEFLKQKEWFDELEVLIQDLSGPDGTVRKGAPDPTSDTYVSFCKVKAVYGRIDKFEVLSRMTAITRCLGTTKTVRSQDPEEFRQKVEKYIQTKDHDAGMQYWPIVKHVRLRMPNCDACSSGAVLVDLPGVRDSNAARDKIAKEYLKNCTAVWVVSGIHRAIDDKTAKSLLGENFRRQLLMDGQYGSIAFICSKTDVLVPSEIINNLQLEAKTAEIETRTSEMEQEKGRLRRESRSCQKEVRELTQQLKAWKKEVEEIQSSVMEVSALLDPIDVDSEETEDKGVIEELQEEMKNKESQITEGERTMKEKEERIDQCQRQVNEIENKLIVERKEIAAICARARNEYAKREIKKDFKAGLKEMKRQAGANVNEEADDYDDDDNDNDGSSADNLQVFCCSATEYQKMKNLLTDDGPSQVFNSIDDTEVPALRNYVHTMTSVRKKQWVERLIRSLGRFVFDLHNYTADNMLMSSNCRLNAKSTINVFVEKCRSSLGNVIETLSTDIEDSFESSIRTKLDEGTGSAINAATNTCCLWGAKHNYEKANESATGRKSTGLHFSTYRATVNRQGVFKSPSYGQINFNEDLTDPIYRCLTIVWDRVFSGLLWKLLEKVKQGILGKLKEFSREICLELSQLGVPEERGHRVCSHLLGSATNKLNEMIAELKGVVTNKQREISRVVTPHIQDSLTRSYDLCAMEHGTGMFNRIKDILAKSIDKKKYTMFDAASEKLMAELLDLKEEVVQCVRAVSNALLLDLKTVFEPLWEAPTNYRNLQATLKQPLLGACSAIREIYRQAGITNTEENASLAVALPSSATVAVTSASLSPMGNCPTKAVLKVVKQSATSVLALPSTVSTPSCHAVSLLAGQRYEQRLVNQQALGQTGVNSTLCIKQEPDIIYGRTAEEGQRQMKVVHVKQELTEYTCAELNETVPITTFGQHTLKSLSEGKLELLPVETSAVPVTSQAVQPVMNRQVPSVTACPQNSSASLPHTAAQYQAEQGKCPLTSQSDSINKQVKESEYANRLESISKLKSVNKLAQQVHSPVTSAKYSRVDLHSGKGGNSPQNHWTVSLKSNKKENKNAKAESQEETQSGSNGSRFQDRLERLSQNFDSHQDNLNCEVGVGKSVKRVHTSESQTASPAVGNKPTVSVTTLQHGKHRSEVTLSPEKTFLKEASTFGARISSLMKRKAPLGKESDNSDKGSNSGSEDDSDINSSPNFSQILKRRKELSDTKGGEAKSSSGHKKRRTVRASLSLSRRNTPQKKASPLRSPSRIKTEPEDDGYYGQRRKVKLTGFIDLTVSDDSD